MSLPRVVENCRYKIGKVGGKLFFFQRIDYSQAALLDACKYADDLIADRYGITALFTSDTEGWSVSYMFDYSSQMDVFRWVNA